MKTKKRAKNSQKSDLWYFTSSVFSFVLNFGIASVEGSKQAIIFSFEYMQCELIV